MCEEARLNGEIKAIIDRERNYEITREEAQALLHELSLKSPPYIPRLGPGSPPETGEPALQTERATRLETRPAAARHERVP
jgi:hypothetical protein